MSVTKLLFGRALRWTCDAPGCDERRAVAIDVRGRDIVAADMPEGWTSRRSDVDEEDFCPAHAARAG